MKWNKNKLSIDYFFLYCKPLYSLFKINKCIPIEGWSAMWRMWQNFQECFFKLASLCNKDTNIRAPWTKSALYYHYCVLPLITQLFLQQTLRIYCVHGTLLCGARRHGPYIPERMTNNKRKHRRETDTSKFSEETSCVLAITCQALPALGSCSALVTEFPFRQNLLALHVSFFF